MADGFLSRWARRKEAVRKGEEVAPEEVRASLPPSLPPSPASGRGSDPAVPPSPHGAEGPAEDRPPPPTLADAESLTPASDFSRFVRADVDPAVKNAAVKKLWADPRFNIQDGLDVYIDDYGKPDPMPAAMLRSLASAKFLKLFDEEEEKEKEKAAAQRAEDPTAREVADAPGTETVAQSGTADPAVTPAEHHADPDLRLQQDDAPGPEGPGAGPR